MSDHSNVDVRDLNDSQVSTLLALGLLAGGTNSESSIVGLIAEINDPNSDRAQTLLRDLQAVLNDADQGPASLTRLSGLASSDVDALRKRSLLSVLTSLHTSPDVMSGLIKYGEALASPTMPPSTRLTGFVIATLAQLGLFTRVGKTVESWDRDAVSAVLELLVEIKALPPAFVETVRKMFGKSSTIDRA